MKPTIHAAFKMDMVGGERKFYGHTICGRPLGYVGLNGISSNHEEITCKKCLIGRSYPLFYRKSISGEA